MRWYLVCLLFSALLLCKGQDMDHGDHRDDDGDEYRDDDGDEHRDDDGDDDDGHREDDDNHDNDDRDDDGHDDHDDHDDRDEGPDNGIGCSNVHITGRHDLSFSSNTGYIVSPNFPHNYPTDEFACAYHIENEAGGHVQLVFDDFMLAHWDVINIRYGKKESSKRHTLSFYGNHRPVSIVSKGHSIWIDFNSGRCDHTATGFKATYKFVEGSTWEDRPIVRQSVRSHASGEFYVMNFLHRPKHIDKIWILKGLESQGLLIGIQEMFVHDGGEDSLEIRDGPTSEGALLARIGSPVEVSGDNHYISRFDSVYVRLRSELYHHDKLIGTFVSATDSASTGTCPDGYFHCKHGYCIVSNVVCDGFDHCGDNSDEEICHSNPTIAIPGDPFDCAQCMDGATCVPELHICSCPAGHTGAYCEYPDERLRCEKCQNGATCTRYDDDRYSVGCFCPPDYYGTYCELFEERKCEGCANGGKCTDPYNGECVCPEAYYGLRCEHGEEPEDRHCGGCHNDGKCRRDDGYCVCPRPYYGPHCEYSDEYECCGGCLHGGECVYGDCQCGYGYYGDRCQYMEEPPEPDSDVKLTGWGIGFMVFGSVLVIVLLVTITYCVCSLCRKSAPSKVKHVKPYSISAELKYSPSLQPPPPSYDNCHDNPTYVTVTDGTGADNVSLPPAYDEVNRYSNNPYLADDTETEKAGPKGNEDIAKSDA